MSFHGNLFLKQLRIMYLKHLGIIFQKIICRQEYKRIDPSLLKSRFTFLSFFMSYDLSTTENTLEICCLFFVWYLNSLTTYIWVIFRVLWNYAEAHIPVKIYKLFFLFIYRIKNCAFLKNREITCYIWSCEQKKSPYHDNTIYFWCIENISYIIFLYRYIYLISLYRFLYKIILWQ